LRTKGTLTADNVHVGNESVARAQVSYDFGGLGRTIPHGTLAAGLDGVVAGIQLRRLDAQLKVGSGTPLPVNVALTAEDSLGRRDAVTADFEWQVRMVAGRLTDVELALPDGEWRQEAAANFSESAGRLTLTGFNLSNGESTLALDGSIGWKGAQNFVLKANLVDLADFNAIMPQAYGLGGALALEAQVGGTAAAPIIDARLGTTTLKINAQRFGNLDLKANYAAHEVTIDATLAQDARHDLTARGTLPGVLQWANGFKARVGGDINLRVYSAGLRLDPWGAQAPGIVKDLAGLLAVDLTLRGPIERPRANGTLVLNGGRAQIVSLGVIVTGLVTRLNVYQNALRVVGLAAQAGDGTLAGNGTVSLSNYLPGEINAHLSFHNWPAIATRQYRAIIDGNIMATGTSRAPRIGGEIDVLHATLRPDLAFLTATSNIAPDPTIVVIQSGENLPPRQGPGTPSEPHPPYARRQPSTFNQTAIDLQINIHRDSWIRHEDAVVNLEGDMRIIKESTSRVQIIGVIRMVRGWINFQNRRFNLTRGAITFTGGSQMDPSLDVDAQYKVTGYVIDVLVGGTANKPTLKLSSQPELPQADILSLLLFGKTASALGKGQQATLQQQATTMAAGYAASSIGQTIMQSLGLQALGLEMTGVSGSGGTVGFGHYLTENAYVSVSQQVGGANGQTGIATQGVSVQYYIFSWLSVKSTSYSDGSREIALSLTKQY
jgi:translocation and assembly module TamB